MKINLSITPEKLLKKTEHVFDLAGQKIASLNKSWDANKGTPVFTVKGKEAALGLKSIIPR